MKKKLNSELKLVKDRIFTKLKMLKHRVIVDNNNCERKLLVKDVVEICEQLEEFIDFIRSTIDFDYFINDLPANLESRFDESVQELEGMLREIKSAHVGIQKQRAQQNFVEKEKVALRKTLNKLKDNEIREMENVASMFDQEMFSQWEIIKTTKQIEQVEQFLCDVKNKQLALENLNILSSQRLSSLSTISKTDDSKNKKFPVVPNLRLFEKPIPPPPPPPSFPPIFFPRRIELNILPEIPGTSFEQRENTTSERIEGMKSAFFP